MNINGVIFLSIISLTMQNLFSVIHVFSLEVVIFLRESKRKLYRSSAYFLGKSIAELPLNILIPIIYMAILWPMANLFLDDWHRFLTGLTILIIISQVATSFGYFVSCISGSIQIALALGPVLVVPFMLMGGFFLNYKTVPGPLKWMPYISWFLYGNEAMMITQWKDVKNITCGPIIQTCLPNGKFILDRYGFEEVGNTIHTLINLIDNLISYHARATCSGI